MIDNKALIYIPVFLFPILIATVNHGGSVLYLLLLLFGLFLGWPAWQSLESWEKRVLLGFSLFFILISISFLNAQDYYNGVKKLEKYLLFPLLVPMYLLLKRYQIETGKMYLLGLLVASAVMFGLGIFEGAVNNLYRIEGAYNALIFGDVAMFIAVILICALFTVANKKWHYLLGLLVVGMALAASVMSGSRGGWILLPVIALWLLWLFRRNLRSVHLISIVIIISLSIWGALNLEKVKFRMVFFVKDYQAYSQNIDGANETSLGVRLELWRDSITIWKDHPIIGTGVGDYYIGITQLINEGRSNSSKAHGHAHNIYFNTLAISGLVGLIALLVFVQLIPFLTFHYFWKKEHDPWIRFYAMSGMATIIAFVVFGLTLSWLDRNPFVRTYLMSILVFMSSIAIIKNRKTG